MTLQTWHSKKLKSFSGVLTLLALFAVPVVNAPNVSANTQTTGGGSGAKVSPHNYYDEHKTYSCASAGSGYRYLSQGTYTHPSGHKETIYPAGCYKLESSENFGPISKTKPTIHYSYTRSSGYSQANISCVTQHGKWVDNGYNAQCKDPQPYVPPVSNDAKKKCTAAGRKWVTLHRSDGGYCGVSCIKSTYTYDSKSKKCVLKDKTPPKVTLTYPSSGTYSSIIYPAANASDKSGISKVVFSFNKKSITDTGTPYKKSFSLSSVKEGTYTVTATAYDKAGNKASASRTITVSHSSTTPPSGNPGTPEPPTGSGGSSSNARANCTDKLHHVWKDGKCLARCQDGFHHASDRLTSKCVPNKVKTDKQKPTVELTAPADETTVKNSVRISATAKDNVAVKQVDFYNGNKKLFSDTTKPYSKVWSKMKKGTYTVYVVAVDSNGNKATSEKVQVTADGKGTTSPVTGQCTKDFKLDSKLATPAELKDKGVVKGYGFTTKCPKAGQSVGLHLNLGGSYQAEDLTVYRKTAAGKYTDVTSAVTLDDVDNTTGTGTHVRLSFKAKDGDKYDLQNKAAAISNELYIAKPATTTPGGPTTPTTPEETIDANSAAKRTGVLPNTGTSSLLGLLALVAAMAGAGVYVVAKKRGAHLPKF